MTSYRFTKTELDSILSELGKELNKRIKGKKLSYELIVVGGASILLNYSFRMSTVDIDCLDVNDALMNEIISSVGEKYNLPNGYINTDFIRTNSYTPKIIQFSSFYKSYSNGALVVRTIKDEYLIAMKMVAARKYKHDYSDIFGIIKENPDLSYERIEKAIADLYGSDKLISVEMKDFVKELFNKPSFDLSDLEKEEESNKEMVLKRNAK